MAYEKTNWVDNSTDVNAEAMNKIETQLEFLDTEILKYFKTQRGNVSNFNSSLDEGQYNVSSGTSITNAPYTGAIYGTLIVLINDGTTHNNSTNWIWQIFKNTGGEEYIRNKVNNGAWSAWVKVSILGVAEKTKLTMSEKIITDISYANRASGEYKKKGNRLSATFVSGTAITDATSFNRTQDNDTGTQAILNTGSPLSDYYFIFDLGYSHIYEIVYQLQSGKNLYHGFNIYVSNDLTNWTLAGTIAGNSGTLVTGAIDQAVRNTTYRYVKLVENSNSCSVNCTSSIVELYVYQALESQETLYTINELVSPDTDTILIIKAPSTEYSAESARPTIRIGNDYHKVALDTITANNIYEIYLDSSTTCKAKNKGF